MKRTVPCTLVLFIALIVSMRAFAADTITLFYVPISAFTASFVAKDNGYFAQRGLNIDMKIAPTGGSTLASLVADAAQIGTTTPPQLLQADEQGLDIVAVGGGSTYPVPPHGNGLVARTNSAIKTAADLVGKKVAIPGFGGTLDIPARAWVGMNGIDAHKVDWVELQFPQLSDALKSGLIDAEATTNPFESATINAGIGYELVDFNTVIPRGALATAYASTRSWATKNPTQVAQFQQALADAIKYINDPMNADAVRKTVATYTHLPPQVVATMALSTSIEATPKPDGFTFWIDSAQQQGLIQKKPDPASLIARP